MIDYFRHTACNMKLFRLRKDVLQFGRKKYSSTQLKITLIIHNAELKSLLRVSWTGNEKNLFRFRFDDFSDIDEIES